MGINISTMQQDQSRYKFALGHKAILGSRLTPIGKSRWLQYQEIWLLSSVQMGGRHVSD